MRLIDAEKIREDFPILRKRKGKRLVYLDSASTSQKPECVIEKEREYYSEYNANVHRAIYPISERATEEYEGAREKVAGFIGAKPEEIIFTKNCTEALNLAARLACQKMGKGDSILLTEMGHHSSIVPWQIMQKEKGIGIRWAGIDKKSLQLDMESFEKEAKKGIGASSFIHASNVLSAVNPARKLSQIVHKAGALAIVDGAQSAPHMKVDVKEIGCDFFAFSGHKMLAPTGVGVLYGKKELLKGLDPPFGGGGAISEVRKEGVKFARVPGKFEPGTPNISGVIALGEAVGYLQKIGMANIQKHECEISTYCKERLSEIPGVSLYVRRDECGSGVVSFNLGGVHPHDVSGILGERRICIRAGHHCAQPLHDTLGLAATARASFYLYNTKEDVDILYEGVKKARGVFQ